MSLGRRVVRVAVPSPLDRHFDYLLPGDLADPLPGARVRVPFGRRETIGVVLGVGAGSEVPDEKLRPVVRLLDHEPLFPASLLELLTWAAGYYHHPIGDVMQTALPVLLRRGADPGSQGETRYRLANVAGDRRVEALRRSPAQQRLYQILQAHPDGVSAAAVAPHMPNWRAAMQRLQHRGWVVAAQEPFAPAAFAAPCAAPALADDQRQAVDAIVAASGGFQCLLLHGITGSGKTEVYLQAIARVIAQGRQAMVLVPEIGLTPQLMQRFRERLAAPVAVLHSGLSDGERLGAWQAARTGRAQVVIGTRSTVFVPLPNLALIVVDEEHDASFKQQDGFRYHARDVAIKRARLEGIPIVLGSATPSLESLYNAEQERYRLLSLPKRAGAAAPPRVGLLDMRRLKANQGLSPPLIAALRDRLQRGEQSLLFLNRRGFAPVLMCHSCGWLAPCQRCDAKLTLHRDVQVSREAGGRERPLHVQVSREAGGRERPLHRGGRQLRCHHCGAEAPLPTMCPACGSAELHGIGAGTERVEAVLTQLFPQARIERIDRDTTRRKDALETKLARVRERAVDILVGTQMLTKGHDFPELTLVGVLNADQGLYSADFRGEERLVQQLVQVTGRAGRAGKPGEVLVQTWHPDNPVFAALAHHDYREFARYALAERAAAGFPPFSYLALVRAESPASGAALAFLRAAAHAAAGLPAGVQLMDAVPSPMERRAGRYRAQLLVQAAERRALHEFLHAWLAVLRSHRQARQVRWSVDVDPIDLF
jgi:primosomal protein N' (replication factor Y)